MIEPFAEQPTPAQAAEAAALVAAAQRREGRPLLVCSTAAAARHALAVAQPGLPAPLSLLELATTICAEHERRPLVPIGAAEAVALLAAKVPDPSPRRLRAAAVGLAALERLRLANRPLPTGQPGSRLLLRLAAWEEELANASGAAREGLILARAAAHLERHGSAAAVGGRTLLHAPPRSGAQRRLLAALGTVCKTEEVLVEGPAKPARVRFWEADDLLHGAQQAAALAAQAAGEGRRVAVVVPEFRETGREVAAALRRRSEPFLALDGPEQLAPSALRDLLAWLRLLLYRQPLAALRLLGRPPYCLAEVELSAAARGLRANRGRGEALGGLVGGLGGNGAQAARQLAEQAGELTGLLDAEEASSFLPTLLARTGLLDLAAAEGRAALASLRAAQLLWQRLADLQPGTAGRELARQLLAVAAAGLAPAGFPARPDGPLTVHRLGGEPVGAELVVVLLTGTPPLPRGSAPPLAKAIPPPAAPAAVLAGWLSGASEEAVLLVCRRDRHGRERVFPAAERLRRRWGGVWEQPALQPAAASGTSGLLAAFGRTAQAIVDQPLGVEQRLYDLLATTYSCLRAEAIRRGAEEQAVDGLLEETLPSPARAAYRQALGGMGQQGELAALLPRRGEGLALSPTDLANYLECPYRYKLSRLLRFPVPPNRNQRFGIAIHRVLERFHRRYATNPAAGAGEQGWRFLEALLEAAWQRLGLPGGQLYDLARGALHRYHRELAEEVGEVALLEEPFTLPLGRHLLSGRIDRIDRRPDGSYELIDYKTSRPRPRAELLEELQLPLYALAATRRLGSAPAVLTYHYVIDGRRESIAAAELRGGFDGAARRAQEVAARIERLEFNPTPSFSACNRCEFLQICPAAEG